MTDVQSPDVYTGRTAVDPNGTKIGSVGQVYVNDDTGVPDWITVNTGLFGLKESFAPLQGSTFAGDDLVLPFGKDVVKDAPDVSDSSHLDTDEVDRLYSYYRQYVGVGTARGAQNDIGVGRRSDDTTTAERGTRGARKDTSGRSTDEMITRSEEQLNVGTEQVETGRVRLRKYVVTENQTVRVPVSHEEVVIEREPITDTNRDEAFSGPDISEEEHEVLLHAERPVVLTEAVPVERVRLGTKTVTDTETVSGEVRKEQIEITEHDERVRNADTSSDNADYQRNG